jgi:hypothetical protein
LQPVLFTQSAIQLEPWVKGALKSRIKIGPQLPTQKQQAEGWSAKVIDRLSHDLKTAFPDMSGFSPRNLKYMRKFAECWPDRSIVQRTVAQIP